MDAEKDAMARLGFSQRDTAWVRHELEGRLRIVVRKAPSGKDAFPINPWVAVRSFEDSQIYLTHAPGKIRRFSSAESAGRAAVNAWVAPSPITRQDDG